MKIASIIIGATIGLMLFWMVGTYNSLVGLNERVEQTYAQVQNVMQRQADLIPNLVETTKGYANHESGVFKAVSEARSQLSAVAKMNPKDLANDPALQKQLIEAQANTNRAMVALNAVREAYPALKADRLFNNVMTELAGSQNRITVERRNNQLAVQEYNQSVKVFPQVVVARVAGFSPKPYFQASDAAQTAPQVKF